MSKQTKYRIFELSKEFKKDSKVIIDVLRRNKIKVVNNFSAIGEDEYQILKSAFAPKMPSKKAETQSQPQQSTQQQTQQTQQTAQPKVETKPVEKVEAKPAEKVESKVETKTEPKPEAKSDSQQQNQNRSGQKFQRRQFDQKPRFMIKDLKIVPMKESKKDLNVKKDLIDPKEMTDQTDQIVPKDQIVETKIKTRLEINISVEIVEARNQILVPEIKPQNKIDSFNIVHHHQNAAAKISLHQFKKSKLLDRNIFDSVKQSQLKILRAK